MRKITIRQQGTNREIINAEYADIRHALEDAVTRGISLQGAIIEGAILDHANLDGGDFRGATFRDCSLCGANISEADLSGAKIQGCDLESACLCASRLHETDFRGSSFAATLIAGAHIDGCAFSCPSAFSLGFAGAKLGRNYFMAPDGAPLPFTAAPVVVEGLPERIVFLDAAVFIGQRLYLRESAGSALRDELDALAQVLAACG